MKRKSCESGADWESDKPGILPRQWQPTPVHATATETSRQVLPQGDVNGKMSYSPENVDSSSQVDDDRLSLSGTNLSNRILSVTCSQHLEDNF